jgi:hypothetical protein
LPPTNASIIAGASAGWSVGTRCPAFNPLASPPPLCRCCSAPGRPQLRAACSPPPPPPPRPRPACIPKSHLRYSRRPEPSLTEWYFSSYPPLQFVTFRQFPQTLSFFNCFARYSVSLAEVRCSGNHYGTGALPGFISLRLLTRALPQTKEEPQRGRKSPRLALFAPGATAEPVGSTRGPAESAKEPNGRSKAAGAA